MTRFKFSIVSLLIHLVVPTASAQTSGPVSFGPTAYLSSADVPDGFHPAGALVSLEDFEDGSLDFGITASVGKIINKATSSIVDSVDADDGFIDGSGLDGSSWFFGGGSTGVVFTFSEELPTSAGLVWTDGAGTTSFEAFGPGMISLGTIGPVRIADSSVFGTTGDDRFFGVQSAGGILAIKISNSAGGIEVDHVQFSTNCIRHGEIPAGFELEDVVAGVTVPGNANPFLAGQPDGVTVKADSAPAESPIFATKVTPGDILTFSAEGAVSFAGAAVPITSPDGGGVFQSGSALGIAGYTVPSLDQRIGLPADALVGVFLSDSIPAHSAPESLNYPDGLSFEVLAPQLHQIFFIGDGLSATGEGIRQEFIVPNGATRLFLGTSDGFGWFNNTGSFNVSICRLRNLAFSSELGPTTVGFNLPEYTTEAGVPLAGSVVIDPLPPGGIYSQGMVINVRSEDGTLAGVVTPAAASRLNNDGPLLGEAGAEMSDTGLGGIKGTALFSTARSVLTDPTLASFTLADLPPGSYTLEIEPWNELGPTEDIFVTGRCLTLDSFITFGTATLEVTGIFVPEITITGPIVLQAQTGLLEQTLTVTNNSGRVLDSFRVFIGGLPAEVIAWNAHGFIDGIPYIDIFTPLGIGESMELVLEYYRPNRQANFTPTFTIDPTTGSPPVVSIAPLAVDLRVVRKGPESLLVEFLTVKDQFYIVEYSNDMITWTSTVPSILGTGERIQWLDQGPPKTASVPGATRFYRITSGNE